MQESARFVARVLHSSLASKRLTCSQGSTEVEKGDESAQKLHDELWSESLNDWMDVYKTNVVGYVALESCCAVSLIR